LLEKIRKDFSTVTWVLIPIAIGINGATGWIVARLNLPVYMDTIGTIGMAVVAGPWVGALTGLLTNMMLGVFSPGFIPYWPVPVAIGLVAGFCANAGMFKRWWKVVLVGIFVAVTAASISTFIAQKIHGGGPVSVSYFLVEEPVDKIATVLLVFIMTRVVPKKLHAYLPRPENIE
jgi:energy-coupling factor transport system substrate-specific component